MATSIRPADSCDDCNLFARRHRQNNNTEAQEPTDRRTDHVIFRVIAEHGNDRTVCCSAAFPVSTVKSVGFCVKVNMFRDPAPTKSNRTICIFVVLSPISASNLKKALTDGVFRSLYPSIYPREETRKFPSHADSSRTASLTAK